MRVTSLPFARPITSPKEKNGMAANAAIAAIRGFLFDVKR
jgi:hypothetical protein